LLDDGSVTMFSVSLSVRQTRSCGNAYISDRYQGNESLNSLVPTVTNKLAAVVSEKRKLKGRQVSNWGFVYETERNDQ
jgi:hypothetical protein